MKKRLVTMLTVLLMVLNLFSFSAFASDINDDSKLIRYYALVAAVSEEVFTQAISEYSPQEYEQFISGLFENRRQADELNLERDPNYILETELIIGVEECADLFGITEETVLQHVELCGINAYNKIIRDYFEFYGDVDLEINEQTIIGNSDDLVSPAAISSSFWNIVYTGATTGNIFITKDSETAGVRHGHAGIVQSHTYTTKTITEAVGYRDTDADEVICRALTEYWPNRNTLCVKYPLTSTADQRVTAGNHTVHYANGSYVYEYSSTKTNMRKSDYLKLSCAGIIYRVYYFMASFDVVPQVSVSAMLTPSQLDASSVMALKNEGTSTEMKSSGYDSVQWEI